MGLAIVAIPCEDDYVWKISSEKVPHCTLLFLGEVEDKPVERISAFLGHAVGVQEFGPFGLDVDYRGLLGDDKADVLFFKRDRYSFRDLEEFRGQLLMNNDIRDAYDSAEQFPEWRPHLTLGYPEKPAKPDNRDYPGIRWVQFDKIALWTGNYEGPWFRLQYNYDLAEVAMGAVADAGREFIAHYGVKGMRWGVRKSGTTEVTTQSVINKGLRSKTKVKAKGGTGHPATEDAIKAAAQKQKLRKSGPAALSNKELQELGQRLQLEQQVTQLAAPKGKKFVSKTLGNAGQQQVSRVVNEQASKQVDRAIRR